MDTHVGRERKKNYEYNLVPNQNEIERLCGLPFFFWPTVSVDTSKAFIDSTICSVGDLVSTTWEDFFDLQQTSQTRADSGFK